MTGIYIMVYQVKEADNDDFLDNYFGDIFSIGDGIKIITVKKGGGVRYFQMRIFQRRIFTKRRTVTHKSIDRSVAENERRNIVASYKCGCATLW